MTTSALTDEQPAKTEGTANPKPLPALEEEKAILANIKVLNARVDKYRAASKALRAEEDALDTTRQADVDSLSQRMDALNALLEAHDVDAEAADRAQQSLEEAAAAHNRRCAGMMLDQFVMEAVTRGSGQ